MSVLEEALAVRAAAKEVCSAQVVRDEVARCAVRIDLALRDTNPIMLPVLQGGLYFAGQLLPLLRFPLEQGSVHVSRYGGTTPGELVWRAPPTVDVRGRTVLLVDDVFDEGLTLAALVEDLRNRGARKVYSAVLVNKDVPKKAEYQPDEVAMHFGNGYLFGCGMDYKGYWRNLPEIYEVAEE